MTAKFASYYYQRCPINVNETSTETHRTRVTFLVGLWSYARRVIRSRSMFFARIENAEGAPNGAYVANLGALPNDVGRHRERARSGLIGRVY